MNLLFISFNISDNNSEKKWEWKELLFFTFYISIRRVLQYHRREKKKNIARDYNISSVNKTERVNKVYLHCVIFYLVR